MNRLISFFLFLLLSSSFFIKVGIIIKWELNKEYIAQNLCEKREEKNNCCKGKCQLKKELQKSEGESSRRELSTKFQDIDNFVFQELETQNTYLCVCDMESPEEIYILDYSFEFKANLIKPPTVDV